MRKRIVVVDKKKCNPVGCGGYLCMRVSPSNKMGKEAFVKDDDGKIKVNEELVTDADSIAVNKCPFNALKMVRLPEALNKDPIHRYGANGFALYNLPVPIFGKVVGIIGRNGIGKSTAIKILSGLLKPNLGRLNEAGEKEIINYFKGTEAQSYFEKLYSNNIVISYKPQQVELIPKAFEGTVGSLLKKVNEKPDDFNNIINALALNELLDRDIKVISGGELQRVAIAATVLKKANVYFFDEPTSYLDIKQRLRVSKFIRSLINDETAVMVVEHDLIILDYLTDLIHILYGKENVYGISSLVKSSKAGINTYLEGYLREENIRFRDKKIIFEERPPLEFIDENILVEWPFIEKKLGSFSLKATKGLIFKHEVIGVLGENGIGKSSFVKELSLLEAETKTGLLKIAFKPQYLEASDESVAIFLKEAMRYKTTIINPLNLESLFHKNLNELSGGQLQRVMIAKTLSKDADLYIFDEPSAYLDVEQRLLISKVIREHLILKGSSAIIVDHDLLFIDYLSHRLIIFEGKPGIEGKATGPYNMEEGMNLFLKDLGITFRRDEETKRPRANKENSIKDREQKSSGKLYYA